MECIKETIKRRSFIDIARRAEKEHVAQILYHVLFRSGLVPFVHNEGRDYLEKSYARHITRNVFLRHELMEVLNMLNKYEVKVMLLKGAVSFFERYLGDVPLRYLQDIDLLIESYDFEKALKCFSAMGYKECEVEHDFHKVFCKTKEINYFAELHYLPSSKALLGYFQTVSLWENATRYKIEETVFYVPSPTHLFYYKVLHDTILHKRLFRLSCHDLYDGAAMVKYYGDKIWWGELLAQVKNTPMDLSLQVYLQAIVATGLFIPNKEYVPIGKKVRKYVDWIYLCAVDTKGICAKERFIFIHYDSQNVFHFFLKSFCVLWNTYTQGEDKDVLVSLYQKMLCNKYVKMPYFAVKGIHFVRLLILHGVVLIRYWMRARSVK